MILTKIFMLSEKRMLKVRSGGSLSKRQSFQILQIADGEIKIQIYFTFSIIFIREASAIL
jgi:hypothetical protein